MAALYLSQGLPNIGFPFEVLSRILFHRMAENGDSKKPLRLSNQTQKQQSGRSVFSGAIAFLSVTLLILSLFHQRPLSLRSWSFWGWAETRVRREVWGEMMAREWGISESSVYRFPIIIRSVCTEQINMPFNPIEALLLFFCNSLSICLIVTDLHVKETI